MQASLFITCFNDTLFPETGRSMVRLLERLGVTVDFPREQTCCGQMHANSGYELEAVPMVRRFVHAFEEADAIVTPSASCAATVRHQYARLARRAGEPELERRAEEISRRVFELSEYLVDRLGVEDVEAHYPHRVAYHPSCHSLRSLEVGERPLQLLRAVRGIELRKLPAAEECCGFGGTFAVKNSDVSAAMLLDKLRAIRESGAEVCTAVDNSCLLHIGGGLSRNRAGVRVVHLAEILASTEE